MIVKKVHKGEVDLVVDLFDQYRVFYKKESDKAVAKKFLQDRLNNHESVIFVAIENINGEEIPVGFTQLYTKFSSGRVEKNWILNDLFVEPEFRKRGIGEALIKHAIQFAKADGAKFVEISTAVDNYTAQKLYEDIGFKKMPPDDEFYSYKIGI